MLMHTPEKAKYPALTLVEVLLSFLKIKQGDNEDLLDYLSQFKSERDIVKRLFRNKLIDGYIEGLPEYTAAVQDAAWQDVKSRELDKFLAVLFLRNANHERFGDLLFEYRKAFANDEEKYSQRVCDRSQKRNNVGYNEKTVQDRHFSKNTFSPNRLWQNQKLQVWECDFYLFSLTQMLSDKAKKWNWLKAKSLFFFQTRSR